VSGGRRLILLRHAKSDWPDLADHDRPLAKRGRGDAPLVGRWLGESGYVPDAVVCSTAQRARETWELAATGLVAAVPGASPAVRYEPRVYEAAVLGLLMLVREFPPDWHTVLVVGHNPGMAELTAGLSAPLPDPPQAFPTAAAAVLELPGDWATAAPGEARLLEFRTPRLRRAAGAALRAYRGTVRRPTRWVTENGAQYSRSYIERFRRLASEGADLAGEARMVDAMLARSSRVLDAGCGQGRTGAELAARGHRVTGVDADAELIAAASAEYPQSRWVTADLAGLDLSAHGDPGLFDAAVMAGNVMLFVAEGTEQQVLRRVAAHLRPDGFAVVGFAAGRGYELPDFDRHAVAAGLVPEHRFATWDLRPWRSGAPFSVTVLRK